MLAWIYCYQKKRAVLDLLMLHALYPCQLEKLKYESKDMCIVGSNLEHVQIICKQSNKLSDSIKAIMLMHSCKL